LLQLDKIKIIIRSNVAALFMVMISYTLPLSWQVGWDIMSYFCASGRLSGVMDDRGKFIYISQEEMKAVADYIKRQGRVSISHLASKSNQFIDLEPKVQYIDDINIGEEITVN